MNTQQAHSELLVLGLEVLFVLGLFTVAEASPNWAPPVVLLLVLLWGVFLLGHSDQVKQSLGFFQ